MKNAANITPIAIINHEPVIKYINHSKPPVLFYRFTMSCNHSSKCKREILLTLGTKRQIKNCLDVGKQNGKKNRGKKKCGTPYHNYTKPSLPLQTYNT